MAKVITNYKNIKIVGKSVTEVTDKIRELMTTDGIKDIHPRRNKE